MCIFNSRLIVEHTQLDTRQAGISLIELVIFIVIVSIGIVGILSVMNVTTKASADPLIRKQALAIAESLLEEVELQAFTFCAPDDPKALTATNATDCSSGKSEDGGSPVNPVSNTGGRDAQNVFDYSGFSMSNPIHDIGGNTITELAGYTAHVDISPVAFAGITIPSKDALMIVVKVTGPSNTVVTLSGYRMRYAPNALP